ncbi:translocation protein TolB [Paenibacillus sp. ACRRX]|uniref:translocation protein TolB n=1 Tax=Paenibacillus sp. ACRRX TaxID=2918206 RepID=UPI001EF5C822|nr:translocation protein TolB [Paenibacillus sp. ACRRX]MCG7407564.1 translocation protein TolB [Paenibacillus sp. ACRRX]
MNRFGTQNVLKSRQTSRCLVLGVLLLIGLCSGTATVSARSVNHPGQEVNQQIDYPQAAYIRAGSLWISKGGVEYRATDQTRASLPKWSADGKFIAYWVAEQNLWVYDVERKRSALVVESADQYSWSPKEHILAVRENGLLSVVDIARLAAGQLQVQQPVVSGVGNYSWTPDGSGFLVSSLAQLQPTGWTNVKLYVVPLTANMDPKQVKQLYMLPSQSDDFFAVGTSIFKWSSDGKWIAFIAKPTASLSADGNLLCVLSRDGSRFYTLDKMLGYPSWFNWAPQTNKLASIAGEGRFSVENKQLTVDELPVIQSKSYTPSGYADRDFTWLDDYHIVVARAKERAWSNTPGERPLPALYRIGLDDNQQIRITNPPSGSGDFFPQHMKSRSDRLTWIRTTRKQADAWSSGPSGDKPYLIIKQLDMPNEYYDHFNWEEVIAWYGGERGDFQ